MNKLSININGQNVELTAAEVESIINASVNMVNSLDEGYNAIAAAGDTLANRLHLYGVIDLVE